MEREETMGSHVIANVRIFDGTGREPFAGEVLVDDNRIRCVTTNARGPRPDGACPNGNGECQP